ncbi:MAG TPA: L-threonylcarbamoyladenylate synthase [Stellaceae bacterium]|nr:L-threonylcarbamoyladenylate synthase [Stellaceae bacterium]
MTRLLTPDELGEAASLLRQGELVAFPTETVYGLGADGASDRAVAAIFAAKERPRFNPLIIHVADREGARGLVLMDARAEALAERFWPGPLSLILPRKPGAPISWLASAGLPSLALRVPAHPLAQALLKAFGGPIAAPSANRSGRVSPTRSAHVRDELQGRIAAILEGGPCRIGVESTVLDLTEATPLLARPGGVSREALAALLGPIALPGTATARRGPGMLASHYAPSLPLRLNAARGQAGEALLAFGPDVPGGAKLTRNLSRAGDLAEAAANLFAALRDLDRPDFSAIAVMPIPAHELGLAINDRLQRAAVRS